MKRVASPGSMHDTGCLGLVHWDDLEGWFGEGGGKWVGGGAHMYTSGGFILIFDHLVIHTNIELLYYPPETNIMLYDNYTSIRI